MSAAPSRAESEESEAAAATGFDALGGGEPGGSVSCASAAVGRLRHLGHHRLARAVGLRQVERVQVAIGGRRRVSALGDRRIERDADGRIGSHAAGARRRSGNRRGRHRHGRRRHFDLCRGLGRRAHRDRRDGGREGRLEMRADSPSAIALGGGGKDSGIGAAGVPRRSGKSSTGSVRQSFHVKRGDRQHRGAAGEDAVEGGEVDQLARRERRHLRLQASQLGEDHALGGLLAGTGREREGELPVVQRRVRAVGVWLRSNTTTGAGSAGSDEPAAQLAERPRRRAPMARRQARRPAAEEPTRTDGAGAGHRWAGRTADAPTVTTPTAGVSTAGRTASGTSDGARTSPSGVSSGALVTR